MRTPSLSRWSSKAPDGRLVSVYEYQGESIPVCDSARDAVATIELFKREDLEPEEKSRRIFAAIFPYPETYMRRDDALDMLASVVWDAFGLDITEGHAHSAECEEAVFDFEEDAARIKSSLLAYYGLKWDEISGEITYPDFMALLSQLAESDRKDTPAGLPNFTTSFAQAIFFRTSKPPKDSKPNRELRKAFMAMRKTLALGGPKESSIDAMNGSMAALFADVEGA